MNELTEDDEGKMVVNASDERIGMVSGVEHGRAHIDPDPGMTDQIKSKLGWDDVDQSDYAITQSEVESVSDDEIRLNR